MQRINGLSTSLYGSSIIVFGGKQSDRLFHLDLLTLEWHCDSCSGVVPPSRLYHAAAVQGRFFYICGGLSLTEAAEQEGLPRPSTTIPYKAMRPMIVYRLDLAELTWESLSCGGVVPMDRSHHSINLVGSHSLALVGGKPVGSCFTETQMKQFQTIGFFDVYVLDLRSETWRKVDFSYASTVTLPRLWSHGTAQVDGGGALLVHGGFAIGFASDDATATGDMEESSPNGVVNGGESSLDEERTRLPTADLNPDFFVLNVESSSCTKFPVAVDTLAPPPRALHNCLLRGRNELVCFGGLVVNEASGGIMLKPSLEMWGWSPSTALWRPLPFCFDEEASPPPAPWPQFTKFPAVMYSETVVVISTDLTCIYLYDGVRWNRMPCDSACFARNVPRSSHEPPAPYSPFESDNFVTATAFTASASTAFSSPPPHASSSSNMHSLMLSEFTDVSPKLRQEVESIRSQYVAAQHLSETQNTLEAIMLRTLLGRESSALSQVTRQAIQTLSASAENERPSAPYQQPLSEHDLFADGLSRVFAANRQRLRRRLTSPPDTTATEKRI